MPAILGGSPRMLERRETGAPLFVKARLRDGVTVPQAQAAMNILGSRLAAEYPEEDPGKGITLMATRDVHVHPQMDVIIVTLASLLLGVVALVLAIACSNLATLLLVRASARAKEVSIRLAIGATRGQLIRHLLTESMLLSAAGGAAGCIFAWWLIRALSAIELPLTLDVSLDRTVLGFAAGLSLVTGVLFGLAPAVNATHVDLRSTLREDAQIRSGHGRWLTLKNALVVFQVTVSVVLLATTGVFLEMVAAARAQRIGFDVDGIAMLEIGVRHAGHSAERSATMFDELRRRVAAIPGVQSAVLTRGQPMEGYGVALAIEGTVSDSREAIIGSNMWAGPGFFEMLQIPVLFGRPIDERDHPGAPLVAVVSETMARQYFGTVNAVGRRFRIEQEENWIEVIGVSRDTGTADRTGDLVDPEPEMFFRPFAQANLAPTTVLARTSLDAPALVGAMQRELLALDPSLPVVSAQTLEQVLERSLAAPRAVAAFLGALGVLGLSLAGIGLYAVIAFAVARRTREIGIRMALGARSQDVARDVVREMAVLLAAGAGVGALLATVTVSAMGSLHSPVIGFVAFRPRIDPLALVGIAGFIAIVGAAAAFVPARRAAGMNPLSSLRTE
jgi:predicted permease